MNITARTARIIASNVALTTTDRCTGVIAYGVSSICANDLTAEDEVDIDDLLEVASEEMTGWPTDEFIAAYETVQSALREGASA